MNQEKVKDTTTTKVIEDLKMRRKKGVKKHFTKEVVDIWFLNNDERLRSYRSIPSNAKPRLPLFNTDLEGVTVPTHNGSCRLRTQAIRTFGREPAYWEVLHKPNDELYFIQELSPYGSIKDCLTIAFQRSG